MKNIAYRIITDIGFVLTIPLALVSGLCVLLVGVHKIAYMFIKVFFGQNDPYSPIRDLVEGYQTSSNAFENLYRDLSNGPQF